MKSSKLLCTSHLISTLGNVDEHQKMKHEETTEPVNTKNNKSVPTLLNFLFTQKLYTIFVVGGKNKTKLSL